VVGGFDEYLVRHTEQPLARVASDHAEWQDRLYFDIHDRNGEVAMITGLGAYPNRNLSLALGDAGRRSNPRERRLHP